MAALKPETAIAIKDRPILFSGPMVRAVIEGRKMQTRRVIKPQPPEWVGAGWMCEVFPGHAYFSHVIGANPRPIRVCPYGKPGDRLWVRETFCLQNNVEDEEPPFGDGRPIRRIDDDDCGICWYQPHYKATDPTPELCCERENCQKANEPHVHWTPSIHMPRWASRLTLEILSVKVERVQDISEEDALAEGIQVLPLQDASDPSAWYQSAPGVNQERTAQASFHGLWDSINSKRGFGWDKNPWVWVIEFKRIKAAQ